MKRYIRVQIEEDLKEKIVLLTGPRQTGKTTFSKNLSPDHDYLNYDNAEQRMKILSKKWNREKSLIIFDELHKQHEWKRFLKGIYDVEGIPPKLLVTGSAKLDVFRKLGDSLAGRFFKHRLYPLDLKELAELGESANEETVEKFFTTSGFPEPFLKGSETFYNRWAKSHIDVILRQDLQDLTTVRHVSDIETLIELLKHRVGSPISYSSLARDLQVSPQTVKNWLILLENLYIIFKVPPYSKQISRAIQKEPKYYFYDTSIPKGENGIKLENFVAFSLFKWLHFLEDTTGKTATLHYIRTRNGNELDFCIIIDSELTHLIEVKWADNTVSKSFKLFQKIFPKSHQVQLVAKLKQPYSTPEGVKVESVHKYLSKLEIT